MSVTSEVKLFVHLLNVVVRVIVFLTSATLIFRGTDISKYFWESFGIRDNESRLYFDTDTQIEKNCSQGTSLERSVETLLRA